MLWKREPADAALVSFGDRVQSLSFIYTNQNGGPLDQSPASARPDLIGGVQRDHRDDTRTRAPRRDQFECDQREEDQVNTPRLVAAARSERGVSMIFTLLSLAMVTVLGLGLTSVAMSTVAQAVAESETTEALAIADAGIEHGKQLVLWQDWQSLNVFLQRGDAAGCTYDELAGTPINIPLPAGYPTTAAELHSGDGPRVRAGPLLRASCATTTRASRWRRRPTPTTTRTTTSTRCSTCAASASARAARVRPSSCTLGAAAMPAVVVEGNLEVKGNPTVTGPAGSIHANGTLELSGNPCTHVYYASVAGTTESGNVQGGTGCTAADVDARPFSPRMNIPKLDPYTVARQAQAAGVAVKTLMARTSSHLMASCTARSTLVALTTAFREARPAAASPPPSWRRLSQLGGIISPTRQDAGARQGRDRARHLLHRRERGGHGQHRRSWWCIRLATSAALSAARHGLD